MRMSDTFELIALGAIWGGSFMMMRVASPEFHPTPLILTRLVIASFLLSSVFLVRPGFRDVIRNFPKLLFLGVINSAIPFSLFSFATISLTAGMTSILNATVPFFGAIVGYVWLNEKLTRQRIFGLVIGFSGVLILSWEKLMTGAAGSLNAIAAALGATFLYGISANFTKKYFSGISPIAIASGSQIGGAIALFPLALHQWPEKNPSQLSWIYAVILGVVCTGVAYLLYFRLIKNLGASRAVNVTFLIPAFGILWGCTFLGETLTLNMIAGGALIFVGVALSIGMKLNWNKP